MDTRLNRAATLANLSFYDAECSGNYIDGAPHIKHLPLRMLYAKLAIRVFDFAKEYTVTPKVIDLGAGEGSVTMQFLELGARVTAIDVSSGQLTALRERCKRFGDKLEVRCEDINETLRAESGKHDIVIANSFLHHVPDYLTMIGESIRLLTPHGQFFSFQDPMRYDSVGTFSKLLVDFAYFTWRVFKADVRAGAKRRFRRSRGIYFPDAVSDNAEYHVIRNGVDQDAIFRLFTEHGFDCEILPYFSTQSRLFQPIGTALGVKNTFGVIARR